MYAVLDSNGNTYVACATNSGDILERAVRKYDILATTSRREYRRNVWLEMKEKGYRLIQYDALTSASPSAHPAPSA